jgi:hypothetical protein
MAEQVLRRALMVLALVLAAPASAQDIFHGWSKDGSWLVVERHGPNERVELRFCATGADAPTWPKELSALEREEEGALSCVRFLDPNKAPYEWKLKLALPPPGPGSAGVSVRPEVVSDGETPGFLLEVGDKTQACSASGVRASSRLRQAWVHPSGRFAAARIDDVLHHCVVTVKPARAPPRKR